MTLPQTFWYDDRDELVGFINWYWEGMFGSLGVAGEIVDCVEKPWHWDQEHGWYLEYLEEQKANA